MHNKQIKKLDLGRETVRHLTRTDLSHVAGGVGPSQGGSDCPSVMLCPTQFCQTKIFCQTSP